MACGYHPPNGAVGGGEPLICHIFVLSQLSMCRPPVWADSPESFIWLLS